MNRFASRFIRIAATVLTAAMFLPMTVQSAPASWGTTSLQVTPKSGWPMAQWGYVLTYEVTVNKSDNTALTGQVCGSVIGQTPERCATPDANGKATLYLTGYNQYTILAQGTYNVDINYKNDKYFGNSQSSVVQKVGPNMTTTTLQNDCCTKTPGDVGDTVYVIVSPSLGAMPENTSILHPTGEIWLYDGNTKIGAAKLQPSDVGGLPHSIAWFQRTSTPIPAYGQVRLVAGSHAVTAVYISDDNNFWQSTSAVNHLNVPIIIKPRH